MLLRCHAKRSGKRKFKFKNPLYSLDSTTIDLCLTLFPWAEFRQTKGAVKLHLLLDDHGFYRPTRSSLMAKPPTSPSHAR